MLNQHLLSLVPEQARVLDLGCGDGQLLALLKQHRSIEGYGVDRSYDSICFCLKQGIDAFQGDILSALPLFSDDSFDVVILSQTLQEIRDPLAVLKEVLRVGKQAIVAFPNFGYWLCRYQLFFGVPPQNKWLPYEWYNTPNIRVMSIKSFYQLCEQEGFKVLKEIPFYAYSLMKHLPLSLSNIFSQKGVFLISKA